MKNFYCQFLAISLCLLTVTQFGYAASFYSDVKNPLKDRNKVENISAKDKKEVRGKNDRPKKEDIPVNPLKPKKKNTVVLPIITSSNIEDVKGINTALALLPMKGTQPLITNLSNQKMVGPDPFHFTITSNKDSISVGEEIELTVTVDWMDFGINNGVRFLPEWYKYVLKIVMPKGFLQTGGDYVDYCTKPVDANNPQGTFTIKGKFEYASEEAKFLVLRGFEGANDLSGFIFEGEKGIYFYNFNKSRKSARIAGVCDCTKSVAQLFKSNSSGNFYNVYIDAEEWEAITSNSCDAKIDWYVNNALVASNQSVYVRTFELSPCYSSEVKMVIKRPGCTDLTNSVIILNKVPASFISASPNTVCYGGTSTITVSGCTGGTRSGTIATINNRPFTSGDTFELTCSKDENSCTNSTTVTVVSPPLINANKDKICAGESVNLSASGCAGGTLSWSNKTDSPSTTTDYTVTCTAIGCTSSVTKRITVGYTLAKPSITSSNETCSVKLTANSSESGITYEWTKWDRRYDDSIVGTNSYLNISDAEYYYFVTISKTGCTSNYSNSNKYTIPTLSAPTATISGTLLPVISASNCPGGVITWDDGITRNPRSIDASDTKKYKATCTLNGCISGWSNEVGNGTYTNEPTDISFSSYGWCAASTTLTAYGCDATKKTRWYLQTGGVYGAYQDKDYNIITVPNSYNAKVKVYCLDGETVSSTSKEKDINVTTVKTIPQPISIEFDKALPVTPDDLVKVTILGCEDNTNPSWSTNGTDFTQVSSGSFASRFSTTTIIYARCEYGSACNSPSINKSLTVTTTPPNPCATSPLSLSLVPNDATCGNSNGQIVATAGGSTQYQFKNGASGTYTTLSATTTNTFIGLLAGSYTIYVKDNQGCEKSETKSVGNSNGPNEPTDVAGGSRRGAGTIDLVSTCASGTITWYNVAVGGSSVSIVSPYSPYLVAEGDYYYYAACRNTETSCESGRIRATATILPVISDPCLGNPSSPSTTGDSREGIGSITVRANCPTAGSIAKWYASNSSTDVLWSGSDYSTTISSTTTFYASCKKDNCETSKVGATATILAISNPCDGNAPSTPSVTSGSIEGTGNVNIYGTCNGNLTRWYANSSGGSPLKTANSSTDDLFTTPTISSTTTFYAVCINNNGCESGRVGVAAVILPPCSTRPIPPACTESSREGAGSITIYASCNNQSGATTRWYDANNNIISNDYALTVTIGTTTSYLASCIKGSCESSRSGVRAIVNPCATPTPSPTNKAICGPGTITLYANCNNNSLRGRWYNSLTSTEVLRDNDHNNNSVSATISSSRLYYTSCVNPDNNCESPRVGVWAIVLPTTLSTATNAEVCQGTAINLQATNTDSFVFGGFAQPLSKTSTYEWRGPNSYVSNIQNPIIPSAQAIHNGIFTSKITNSYTHALLNNGGAVCTAAATASITVYLKPITIPSFILPSICRDVSGILTATNCTSPNTVLWYDSPVATVPVGNGTTYPVLIPDNQSSQTYYADCSSKPELQCNSARASQVVSPLPAPPAPTNAKVNKTNTCISSGVTLSGSCPSGQTIQWFNAANAPMSVLTFNHTAAGVYKYYAGCQDNSTICKTQLANRKEIIVTVAPFPAAPSGASASATTLACNSTTPLTFNGTCSTGQSLRWYSDLGGIITNQPGIYDYYLACQDNVSQCATPVANRVKTTVTIIKPPLTIAPAFDACYGNSLTLSETGATNLEWSGPNGYISNELTPTIGVALPEYNNGVYTVTTKSGGNCSATATTLVTVQPQVKLNIPSSYINICEGQNINLSVSGATSYVWYGPNGYTSPLNNPVITAATPAQSGTYEVVGTVGNCVANTRIEVVVTPLPTFVPTVSLLNAPTTTTISAYPKQIVSLEAMVCPSCSIEWYEKSTGDWQLVPNLGAKIWEIKKDFPGTYQYKIIQRSGACANSNYSNTFTLNVVNCAEIAIEQPSPQYICKDGLVTLSVSTAKRGDNTNFKWFEQVSDSDGGIVEIPTNVSTDFYQVSYGRFIVKSCPIGGVYYGKSNPVVVKGMEVRAGISTQNSSVVAGSNVQLVASDNGFPITGHSISYAWGTPVGSLVAGGNKKTGSAAFSSLTTTSSDGSKLNVSNFQAGNEGKYTLLVSKTIGTTTCVDETNVEVVINPPGCTIDFNSDPVATCDLVNTKGIITINTKDALASGAGVSYRVNCGAWQTSNVFNNLANGAYLVEIKQTTTAGDQGGAMSCRAKSGGRSIIVKCGPVVDNVPADENPTDFYCGLVKAKATPSSFNLEFPEPATLSVTNCSGEVRWFIRLADGSKSYFKDAYGDFNPSPIVTPTVTTSYGAECYSSDPKITQPCIKGASVTVNSVNCANFKFQNQNQLIIDPNTQGANLVVKGCDDQNILWFNGDGTPLISHLGKSFDGIRSIIVYPKVNVTYKAVCDYKLPKTGTGLPNNCSITTQVIVESDKKKQDCAKYYKNVRIKRSGRYNLTLATNEQRTSITINAGDVLEISDIKNVVDIVGEGFNNRYILEKDGNRIANEGDPCGTAASYVWSKYIFDGNNNTNHNEIRSQGGGSCVGAEFEFHYPKLTKNTKLETFVINRYFLALEKSNECSKIIDVKIIDKVPAGLNCDNFKAIASSSLVSIGEAVTLSVIGSNASVGDITWEDTKGSMGGSGKSIIVNPYLTKNTYTVTGGVEKDEVFLSCSTQVEVEVLPLKPLQCEEFDLTANPTLVGDGYGSSTTLTVKGCEGGVLKWIGGANITYNATPTTITTYKAICYLGESETTKEVTINVSKFELKASPEIVGYHPNGYIENPTTTLFATGCNSSVNGTLSWQGGTSDRVIVYPDKTQQTTTYFATCNYTNGQRVNRSVTVRYIQRYINCSFLVSSTSKSSGTNQILSISATNCQGTIYAIPAEGEDVLIYPYKEATWDGIRPAKVEFNITTNRTILYKFICSTTGCISKQIREFNVNGPYQRKTVPQKTNPAEICIDYSLSGQVNTYKIPISFAAGLGGADANVFNDNRQDYSKQIFVSGFTNGYSSIIVTDGACMRNNGKTEWFTESSRVLPAGYAQSKDEYVINFPNVDTYFYGKCTYPNGDFCKTLLLKVIARPKNLIGGRVGIITEEGTLGVNNTAAAGLCKPFKTLDELKSIIQVILKRLLDGIGCSALTLDDAKNILNKLKEQFETNSTLQKYTLNFTNIDATAQLLMNDCSNGTFTAATELVKNISDANTITPAEQKEVLKEIAKVIQKIEVVTTFTYLDPTGYPFSVKLTDNDFKTAKFLYSKKDWNVNYPDYTLYGFEINGEKYIADIDNGNFKGYKTASGKQLTDTKDYTGTKQVRLIHYDGVCKMYSIIYSYTVKPKQTKVLKKAELLITLTGNEGYTKWNMGDCVDVLLPLDQDPQKSNYGPLSLEQRKGFIKRRCPNSIATQIDNIAEHSIIRVIETTPDGQLTEMYNWLNGTGTGEDGRPYLACLFDHIDDAILFGPKRDDNYKNLNLVLANLAFRYKPYQDKAAQIFNNDPTLKNRVIPYTYRSIWQRAFTDPTINEPAWNFSMSNAGIVSIGGEIVTGYEIYNYDKGSLRRPLKLSLPSQNLNPLEPVLLINKSNLLSISDIGDQNGGNIVPACMLVYVDDKARNKTILDAVDAAANIAGVVTGGIVIKAGIGGIARGFTIADIANSSANLGANYFNATINGGNTNPKLQRVLNTWNAINGILGIVRTITKLDDAIDMAIATRNTRILSSHIDDYATSIINAKDELTLLSQEELAVHYVAIERFETEIELSETLANDAVLVDKLKRAKELVRYDFELLTYFKSLGLAEQYYHRAAQLAKSSVIDDFAKLLVKSGTPLTDSKQFVGEIIKGQVAAKTLDNLSIKNFDNVADDIEFAITNHSNKSDIKRFFNEMLSQDEKFKAGTVGLEIIRRPPSYLSGATLVGFEEVFLAGKLNRYDLKYLIGSKEIFVDTKNYSSVSGIFDGDINQVKGYFSKINNIDELFYVIQRRSNFPATDALLSIKKQLSDKVFNFDSNYGFYDEIRIDNPLIFPSMNIRSKAQFEAAVGKDATGNLLNPNHPIFDILKINN